MPVVAGIAQRHVQQQPGERALRVIELRAVHEHFVDPRGGAAVLFTPWLRRRLDLLHVLRGVAEELLGGPQPGAQVGEIGVIVGDALGPPQERCELLGVVVVGPHLGWSDTLHVEEMEVLVRHQRHHEIAERAGRVRERSLRHDVELRRRVLEPAAEVHRLPNDVEKHGVAIVRRAAQQGVFGAGDLLQVGAHVALHAGRVGIRRPHRDPNPLAVHLERVEAVLPDERLRVGELVIVRRGVGSAARPGPPERGRHLPSGRKREAHLGGPVELALFVRKQVRTEEFAELAREPRHREVDRVGEVVELHADAFALTRRHAPRVLVEAIPEQRLTGRRLRAEVAHVARVILDLVVPRAPGWQRQVQRVLAARREVGAHMKQPRRDSGHRDFILHRCEALGRHGDGDEQQEEVAHDAFLPQVWAS